MPASLKDLVELLDLEELDDGLFRGAQPPETALQRVFGGQVAAQSVVAAQKTVPQGRQMHSMHVYFILGGDPSIPIIYDVDNVRDGRSFNTRRVAARQHGRIIFYMTASFQKHEEGWDHQDRMPEVPDPEETICLVDVIGHVNPSRVEDWKREWSSFDFRYVGDNRAEAEKEMSGAAAVQRMWFRADGELPDSQIVHDAAFTYISDFSLLGVSLLPHGKLISSPDVQPASLDHVIWLHRRIRTDQWLLYDQTSPSASGARGLATARVFAADGTLVATVAQEGLIRPVDP